MYLYHIYFGLTPTATKHRGIGDYYQADLTGEDLEKKFVIPYLSNQKFRVAGIMLCAEDINVIKIVRTTENIAQVVEKVREYNRVYYPRVVYLTSALDILKGMDGKNFCEDITTEFLDACESKVSHNMTYDSTPKLMDTNNRKVFIVHGHDNLAISEVKEFLRKIKFNPIVLREQANEGRTIIEKLIDRTQPNEIGYGIVIYTPCDKGYAAGCEADIKARARQNVVFEHGLLMGCLGRNRVHALVKGEIETPGDLGGIIYTTMDNKGAWGMGIVRELKALGYEVDANDLL